MFGIFSTVFLSAGNDLLYTSGFEVKVPKCLTTPQLQLLPGSSIKLLLVHGPQTCAYWARDNKLKL